MRGFKKELTMLGVMVALATVTALLTPQFLGGDNVRNNIRHISLISLFALGEAIIIIAAGIDLSIGALICVTAVMTSHLTMHIGWGLGPALTIAIGIPVIVGAVQSAIIARLAIPAFIISLGFMKVMRGVAEVLTGGSDVGFQGKYPGFRALGDGVVLGMPTPFWFAAIAIILVSFVMHRTVFGRYCYAIGSNAEAARLSGVPVVAVRMATFIAGALLSAFAGVLYVAYLPSATPSLGEGFELDAISAAVLGGCSLRGGKGSVFGVLIGAGIFQITFNAVNLLWESLGQNFIRGAVILIAVIVDQVLENRRALARGYPNASVTAKPAAAAAAA
jgi:ribose transport system permease protein